MVAGAVWTNLKDPDDSDLATVLPKRPHQIAVERLSQTEKYIEEAFPSLESHESGLTDAYLFGEVAGYLPTGGCQETLISDRLSSL